MQHMRRGRSIDLNRLVDVGAKHVNYIFQAENWAHSDPTSITNLILDHLSITAIAMLIGLVIAFPIGIFASRHARFYLPVITLAGILYTIPSLASMALLIPFTGLTRTTVILPMVIYAQVVLIRNIVAAIHSVDVLLIEVGRAMGMNSLQLQREIILPLALPVIVAGIRVATVTTIGIATIAPLFGVQDLGYLIFQGFNTSYHDQVLAGVIIVSLLAVVIDLLLLGVQRLLSRGRRIGVIA
jgi:osmoprotectant transport system permease protein